MMKQSEAIAGWAAPIVPEQPVRLSRLVRRLTQNNPGVFTGPGTNTHLVGTTGVFILDPGEARDDGHFERIVAMVGGATVHGVIPSHGHPDHWTLAPRLAEHFEAPIRFWGEHPGFQVARMLVDGEMLEADGVRLEVLHTPGHTRDHVSLLLAQERVLFPGDHVMGWSTTVIALPEGNLVQYQRSLERLLAIPELEVLCPAHGPAIMTPYHRMQELHAHREARTRQALEALERGPSRVMELVARIYADVDPKLHGAAAQSLLAHLAALEEAGRIERSPGTETLPWNEVVWRIA
jgi:glyoxylase-like metal-dependent hydrolase (beta-lactamase superfamily II)